MSDDDGVDVYVSPADGCGVTGAVVETTPIKAGKLNDEHIGKFLAFHDQRIQRNISGRILRVEHSEGPPPSVSIWVRYQAPPDLLGLSSADDFMRVAPEFGLQIVDTIPF
jgi:hypothetical protein